MQMLQDLKSRYRGKKKKLATLGRVGAAVMGDRVELLERPERAVGEKHADIAEIEDASQRDLDRNLGIALLQLRAR